MASTKTKEKREATTPDRLKPTATGHNYVALLVLLSVALIGGLLAGNVKSIVRQRYLTATPISKTVSVFDNGQSVGGINITLTESHVVSGASLATYLSDFIKVDGIHLPEKPASKIVADRVYTGKGILVEHFSDFDDGERLYLVAPGLLFVWPFVELGHKVHVSSKMSPTKTDIILESFSETPRVFHVHNFFDNEEADYLIERILTIDDEKNKLKQSTVGHANGPKKVSTIRTSENAFDQVSDGAVRIKKRSFDMLRIAEYREDQSDGLQLLRYKQKQAYAPHTDYFGTETKGDWNWDPSTGGSNRFATVFMYLSNVTVGGQSVFPQAWMPEGHEHPPMPSETAALTDSLFDRDSWEHDMVEKCSSRLASYPRKTHAILFYSQKPNGEVDPMSRHGGCPVLEGTKWAANLWVWNRRRYGLDQVHKDKIRVNFVNPTSDTINLYWKDTKMSSIEAGKDKLYSSFHGHEWSLRDQNGNILSKHVLSLDDGDNQTITLPETEMQPAHPVDEL
ncbi:hypothetical protein AeMF1_020961 [Aphanomyces euteiches]|nr:hypothetical protein AeMF1_020961 [Aphanomyces euteiches]